MSHYVVGVVCDDPDSIEEMLAPYNEQPENDSPYLEFQNKTEEVEAAWKNGEDHEGKLLCSRYVSIGELARDWFGYKKIGDNWGYYANPNAKWDWWVKGGRWEGELILKSGYEVDQAKIKDIDFERMKKERIKRYKEYWEEYENEKDEKKKDLLGFQMALRKDETKEGYLERAGKWGIYAILDKHGWHESGEMGWFGMSHASQEEQSKFDEILYERHIKPHQDKHLVIVDCHI